MKPCIEYAIENCIYDFKNYGYITKIQSDFLKSEKKSCTDAEFWQYVKNLNIQGFEDAIKNSWEKK